LKAILLSIKPEYVDRILAGTKKYEYRKRLARSNSSVLLIYSTYPIMKVVAKVEILGTICAAPSTLWEQTKSNAGISRKKYREYFHGCKIACAYELGKVEIFDPPRDLSDYNVIFAPQSFLYVDIE
jgi:predicted transcriptional regulator